MVNSKYQKEEKQKGGRRSLEREDEEDKEQGEGMMGAKTFFFILCLTVWGVEPDVTHQTSWLGSTGNNKIDTEAAYLRQWLQAAWRYEG